MILEEILDEIIEECLEICLSEAIQIYTFAIYFDELNSNIAICIDTKENSESFQKSSFDSRTQDFLEAFDKKNFEEMKRYSSYDARNFSLGDFEVNGMCRTEIDSSNIEEQEISFAIIEAINRNKAKILSQSVHQNDLMFCASGPLDYVQFIWCA